MHDDLDKLIDGALSTYSSAEPLAGLEQRVLSRVRAAETSRRRRWWWAVPVVAVPALAAVLLLPPPRRQDAAPLAAVTPPPVRIAPAPPPQPASPRRVTTARPRRPASSVGAVPKKQVFPTLSPLTPEERLLLQLADSRPQLLAAAPAAQIEIRPLEIAPLYVDGSH